jgi:cytochrome c-type biogenesis protein
VKRDEVIFLNSVFFVIGFTLVFSILGILFQTLLAHTPHSIMSTLTILGGAVILIFGILMIASTRYIIPFFSQEHKFRIKRFDSHYLTSLVFGVAFALGWTPCVGAILGAIYIFAATSPGLGFLLLLAYSIGLGVPFIVVGAFVSRLSSFLKRIRQFMKYFSVVSGVFLVVLGLLVITGYIGELSVFLINPSSGMSAGGQLNLFIAFIAGLLTFLSPCILPLVPAFFSYIAGSAAEVNR